MEDITLDQIIQYILGELPEEEVKRLEQLLQTDKKLSERVEQTKTLIQGIRRAGEKEVEESVKSFHSNFKTSPEFKKLINDSGEGEGYGEQGGIKIISLVSRYKWISLAATVLLLVVVGISIFRNSNNETLFASYYASEQDLLTFQIEYLGRTGMASPDVERRNALKDALNLYSQKDYSASQVSLESYLKVFPGDSVALLYLALNNIENKKYDAATILLKEIITTGKSEIAGLANWYLALTLLKMNQSQEAQRYLSTVAGDGSNRYTERAKELLQKVRSE